jgi:hypothetical protein
LGSSIDEEFSIGRRGHASKLIDQRIAELGDWRGKTLAKVRRLIKEADPEIVEEWKWMGTPVWSHGGINECRHKKGYRGCREKLS